MLKAKLTGDIKKLEYFGVPLYFKNKVVTLLSEDLWCEVKYKEDTFEVPKSLLNFKYKK